MLQFDDSEILSTQMDCSHRGFAIIVICDLRNGALRILGTLYCNRSLTSVTAFLSAWNMGIMAAWITDDHDMFGKYFIPNCPTSLNVLHAGSCESVTKYDVFRQ
jgi:hypothetical protein